MKHSHTFLIALALLFSTAVFSQNKDTKFWSPVKETSVRVAGARQIVPQKFLTFSLNGSELKDKLFKAPLEKNMLLNQSPCIITLPLPNGTVQRFRVVESPVMAEELAAAFPDMKTFSVKGLDDPHAVGKLDWNEFGFHGMILTFNGDFFIDPYCVSNTSDYITYYTSDFIKDPSHRINEGTLDLEEGQKKPGVPFKENTGAKTAASTCVGANLRTYRIAVGCTGEYAKAATGFQVPTVAQTLAKIVTSINRVDGVYEKEVSVKFVLVATETLVIFTDPATDPYTGNNNANILINESQTVIAGNIGVANFDIGHTFSTGGGGLAFLGVVCTNNNKARGITGSGSPVGDPYDIDYVAHEIGHQFSGNHTFNAITGSCNGNRSGSTAVEPGSGVTIMGYAGICSGNNVANRSIANFHAISYDEIVNFTNAGSGNNCPVITSTGNNPPVVTITTNYTIPKSTPFVLTGNATDSDNDVLYYSWEEVDAGAAGSNWNAGTAPYFRSYIPEIANGPSGDYSRYFPRKSVVASGNYTNTIGEFLPKTAQILKFRLTARDNKLGGGGVCYAGVNVTIDDAGPFTLTYPSATGIVWPVSSQQTITWDVNGTDAAPVSCDSIRVWISYDSGTNYSILMYSTLNDGFETITVPALASTTTTCRMKIEAAGNIFYDISNSNFTISTTTPTVSEVGIQQVSASNPVALSVWPNPSLGQVNFAVGNLNSKTATLVNVIDMLGKTVLKHSYAGKTELKEILDLSLLENGVYFIKVSNDNKQSVHRIVKD